MQTQKLHALPALNGKVIAPPAPAPARSNDGGKASYAALEAIPGFWFGRAKLRVEEAKLYGDVETPPRQTLKQHHLRTAAQHEARGLGLIQSYQ